MGPRCSSAETQDCHRSYIIAAKVTIVSAIDLMTSNVSFMYMYTYSGNNSFPTTCTYCRLQCNHSNRIFNYFSLSLDPMRLIILIWPLFEMWPWTDISWYKRSLQVIDNRCLINTSLWITKAMIIFNMDFFSWITNHHCILLGKLK